MSEKRLIAAAASAMLILLCSPSHAAARKERIYQAVEANRAAGLELLMDKIRTTASNDEFLAEIAKGPGT